MKNIFNSSKILKAQNRLNSALDKLEEILKNTNSDNDELVLENEELKEEIRDLMKQRKEAELLKKKIASELDKVMKPLKEILDGNS